MESTLEDSQLLNSLLRDQREHLRISREIEKLKGLRNGLKIIHQHTKNI